ncbi:MAG: hypothetical protein ACYTG7_13745, partial [Planctomycetota bacterium]
MKNDSFVYSPLVGSFISIRFRFAVCAILSCTILLFLLPAVQIPALASAGSGDEIVNGRFRLITLEEERAMEEELAAKFNDPSRNGQGDDLSLGYLPPEYTGNQGEWFQYFVPSVSAPAEGFPIMVCWHGYGVSCQSVAIDSYIDEECIARDWVFLS